MVPHLTMRTNGVKQEFRFVKGIWLHRKIRYIRKKNQKRPILHHTCATYSELPSYISTMLSTKEYGPEGWRFDMIDTKSGDNTIDRFRRADSTAPLGLPWAAAVTVTPALHIFILLGTGARSLGNPPI